LFAIFVPKITMLFEFILIILILLSLFIFLLPRFLVILPTNHFAIVERLGVYNRTLSSGTNLIIWPIEILKELNWSCPVKRISGQMGLLENIQLDVPPIKCISQDRVNVSIDGTLFFSIKTPRVAVYEADDVLNQFYQTAFQAIRNIVGGINVADLTGKDSLLGKQIVGYINERIDKRGIMCREVIIQHLDVDKTEVTYQLEAKIDLQQREHEYELRQAKHRAELMKIEIDATGLTPEQRIEMKRAESIGKAQFIVGLELIRRKS